MKLLTYAGPTAADAPGTRTGGVPHTPRTFAWPHCRECTGPMQFLAQISLADVTPDTAGLLSLFMCQNEPGMCDEWDPTSGGNHAYVFDTDAVHIPDPPADGITLLEETSAVEYADVDGDDYLHAAERWHHDTGRPTADVLGQLGGQPGWLQHDETPTCSRCARLMTFVIQLEEGHDHRTSANFGGGCGYGFRCGSCENAAFLWQR